LERSIWLARLKMETGEQLASIRLGASDLDNFLR
jgi:hypothetical protein